MNPINKQTRTVRRNILDELLEDLNGTFHRSCQSSIDEVLFDVLSGLEALSIEEK